MFSVRVYGEPAPQGSKVAFIANGQARMKEASNKHVPWRNSVVTAIIAVRDPKEHPPITGPVSLDVTFYLQKPKTVKREYPSVRPDADKLIRAVGDALTAAGVYRDDAQVVNLRVRKRYGLPGADITVETAS